MRLPNTAFVFFGLFLLFSFMSCKDKKEESQRLVKEGVVKLYHSRPEEAMEYFNKAIEYDPENPEAYYNLGNAYMNMQQNQQAIEQYTLAIAKKSDYADAYYNRGLVKFYMGERKYACQDFLKAEELGKKNIEDLTKWCK